MLYSSIALPAPPHTQKKNTVSYHLIPSRMATIKKKKKLFVNFCYLNDKDVEKQEPWWTTEGTINWCWPGEPPGKQYGTFLKKLKMELPYNPPILWKDICIPMFVVFYNCQDIEITWVSTDTWIHKENGMYTHMPHTHTHTLKMDCSVIKRNKLL